MAIPVVMQNGYGSVTLSGVGMGDAVVQMTTAEFVQALPRHSVSELDW